MSNANGIITAPVTLLDLQQVFGLTGSGELHKLILSAKTGGSVKPGENWTRAFWTREHTLTGILGAGDLIVGAEPYFNLFSEQSPVEFVALGGELWPRLKKAQYIPEFVNINGVSTRITYSFSLEFLNGYNHNSMKCELLNPADFISTSSTINTDIVYKIPDWFFEELPGTNRNSYIVLSTFTPGDYEDIKNFNFTAFVSVQENRGDFVFQSRLTNLPVYKDQSLKLIWYVSVWDWIVDPMYPNETPDNTPDNTVKHWQFLYAMPNIGKAYTAITNITGGLDRPIVGVEMYITMEIYDSTIASAYYDRISSNVIKIRLYDVELMEEGELWSDDLHRALITIPPGYTEYIEEEVAFVPINFRNFTIKRI